MVVDNGQEIGKKKTASVEAMKTYSGSRRRYPVPVVNRVMGQLVFCSKHYKIERRKGHCALVIELAELRGNSGPFVKR